MEKRRIRVAGKFIISKKLGSGSFGEVYMGENTETHENVAIKLEDIAAKFPQVIFEAKTMTSLRGPGLPKVVWYGTEGSYNIMVLELLGQTLEECFSKLHRKFSTKTIAMLADQILTRIELVHNQNFLHRDIKPDNFLFGCGKKANLLYIIDFGLCKKYREPKTKQHIKFSDKRTLTGTARYASINAHMGNEQSRRDDLEAVMYLVIYLFLGTLPWQGISCANKKEKYRMIMDLKMSTSPEALCRNLPTEIPTMLNYCRALRFEDNPDYSYLKGLLSKIAEKENFVFDQKYDWNESEKKPKTKKMKRQKRGNAEPRAAEEKKEEEVKDKVIKNEEVSTCIADKRWPEFSNREKLFFMIREDKIASNPEPPQPAEPRTCIQF